jgi:hypothetical protein
MLKKMIKRIPFTIKIYGILLRFMPDRMNCNWRHFIRFGKFVDFKNPKTFNEKIQWLKIYGNLQKYTNLADKYEVRKHIAKTIGEKYLIPMIGVWDKFEDIDFEKLPNQFVLKCTHDSGSVVICTDKTTFNIKETQNKLNKRLKRNFYDESREIQYKNIKPRIICEKYMVDECKTELSEYRIFCFNGMPKIIFRNNSIPPKIITSRNIYDAEWNYIPASVGYPTDPNLIIAKPEKLDEMLDLAKILSKNIPHVRVDFYLIRNEIYFGELTFAHANGLQKFEPEEFALQMGKWIELSKKVDAKLMNRR